MREERKIETDMNVITEADFESAEWGDYVDDSGYLRPKFDSVAAYKLHQLTLDGGQSEDHGNAVDWHRWSAIFRNVTESDSPRKSEQPAAILHANSHGITAEWYADGNGAEEVWASLVKEWEEYESACGECGNPIPDPEDGEDGEQANRHHKPSCSLYEPTEG